MSRVSGVRIHGSRFSSLESLRAEAMLLWPRCVLANPPPGVPRGGEADVPRHGIRWAVPDGLDPSGWLGPLDALLKQGRLEARAVLHDVSTWLDCNWKAAVDAHNEAVHVPWLHPQIADRIDASRATVERIGRHGRIRVPAPQGLTDQLFVFPNLHLNFSSDGEELQTLTHWPDPDDPGRCRLDLRVHGAPGTSRPGRPAHRWVLPDDAVFGPVTSADLAALPRVQAGLAAARFPGMAPGPGEELVTHFHEQVGSYVMGPRR